MNQKRLAIYSKKVDIQGAYDHFTELLTDNTYFSKKKLNKWSTQWNYLTKTLDKVKEYESNLEKIINLPSIFGSISRKLINSYQLDPVFKAKIFTVIDANAIGEELRQKRNESYIDDELSQYEEYFDHVESDKLTTEQRRAIIIDEAHNLIVAGAGTGKTSTIIGKAGYILQKGLAEPEELFLLSFARKPQEEMVERVHERLSVDLNVRTFHSLGLEILRKTLDTIPTISKLSRDAALLRNKIEEFLKDNMKNIEFANKVNEYFLFYLKPIENILEISDEEEYEEYIRSIEIRTLNGEKVKSYAECEIANYLFLNGIEYRYEAKYSVDTSDQEHQQYTPDFYLPVYEIWIEHIGVDRNCQTAPEVDRWEYLDDWYWKRRTHERFDTTLIETYSYERSEGTLLSNLEEKLVNLNVVKKQISKEKIFSKLKQLGEVSEFSALIAKFLNLYKSSTETFETLVKKVESHPMRKRYKAFLNIFEILYNDYSRLLEEAGEVDFNDMINLASKQLKDGLGDYNLKYILVDEFQDISQSRSRFLKALLEQCRDCVLFCVGDDWQSIYRFTGSDLTLMTEFEKYFTPCEVMQLTHTFRFNDKIRDVSSSFIMKNSNQIEKQLTAKEVEHNGVSVVWYTDLGKAINETLHYIDSIESEKVSVQIIGRYNQRFYNELTNLQFTSSEGSYQSRLFEKPLELDIEPITAHKAKGSQADYSIIIGLRSGRYGFPSEFDDDPIVQLVLAGNDKFPNAEERRVFYVALTRARKQLFVLADAERISVFVGDLVNDNPSIHMIGKRPALVKCPQCKNGIIHKITYNGKPIFSCNQYPVCNYRPHVCPECREGFLTRDSNDQTQYLCSNEACNHSTRVCPRCNEGYLRVLEKDGKFWACSNYYSNDCTFTEAII